MHAQWAWLPQELQDRIVWYLDQRIIFPDLSQERLSNARLISKAFAAKLRRWLHVAPDEVETALKEMRTDGDGTAEFQEFDAWFKRVHA